MRKLVFALGILFIFSCTKTEKTTTTPVAIQEEAIIFSTNLDTGTYNVADTLPLTISVSSKLPNTGILYSIVATLTDSSKQIFKLDTASSSSSLVLNIPGFKKSGNYSLSLILTSKSSSTNTTRKILNVRCNILSIPTMRKPHNEVV